MGKVYREVFGDSLVGKEGLRDKVSRYCWRVESLEQDMESLLEFLRIERITESVKIARFKKKGESAQG